MIHEHTTRGFSTSSLSQTFSRATFGNGLVAIGSGLLASWAADTWGYVAPFMAALGFLIVGTIMVLLLWGENYGDSSIDVKATFVNAWGLLRNDRRIVLLGTIQSLFEAAMYTFVFMWTPALQVKTEEGSGESHDTLPFGLIFASFMVCMMVGSSLFSIFTEKFGLLPERLGRALFLVSALSLLIPCITSNRSLIAFGFLVFEICCGLYFPCIGTLRGKYIPESSRAGIMNFFRVGLNLLVVVVLVKVSALANATVFLICTIWLLLAFFLHIQLLPLLLLAPPSALPVKEVHTSP